MADSISIAAYVLTRNEKVTASDVIAATDASKSTVYRVLNQLVAEGSLVRQSNSRGDIFEPTDEWQPDPPEHGELGDDHRYTPRIREYANEVVHGEEWPIEKIDLTQVTFETSERMKRRNGVAHSKRDDMIVRVGAHVIDNAGFTAAQSVIRHELIHIWQYQHAGDSPIEIATGTSITDIEGGHNDESWEVLSELLDVERTNSYYDMDLSQYKYAYRCPTCGNTSGQHRLCKSIRQAAKGERRYCKICDVYMIAVRPTDPETALEPQGTNIDQEQLDTILKDFVAGDDTHAIPIDEIEPTPRD